MPILTTKQRGGATPSHARQAALHRNGGPALAASANGRGQKKAAVSRPLQAVVRPGRPAPAPESTFPGLPPNLPRICLALQAPNIAELLAKAEQAMRENVLLELRLDYLKSPETAPARIRQFLHSWPEAQLIATCRRQSLGGKFRGSIAAELALLLKAAQAGCRLVDLELETAEHADARALAELRRQVPLILSHHDFERTRLPEPIFARMLRFQPALYKLAFTARSFADNLVLDRFLRRQAHLYPLVALAMGEWGLPSRLLALRAGAVFTFASFAPGEETAPGQPDISTLRSLYRVDGINRATRVYGVLGCPVEHSLSPHMLNAAFQRESINAMYLPLAAKKAAEILDSAAEIPLSGFSITQPHKSALLDQMDGLDPLARKVGAINTVIRSNGKLYGYNTDVAGILTPLEQRMPLAHTRVLVLGAGGAARAVAFGLKARGAEVWLLNRTADRAAQLARQAQVHAVRRADLKKLVAASPGDPARSPARGLDIIINATPVGQAPQVQQSPLSAAELAALHPRLVFDLVYNPLETQLLRLARAAGADVIPGYEMLVAQGARQFQLWTGKPAPLELMRRELLAQLAPPPVSG